MAIGFLVNDAWAALYGVMLREFVLPSISALNRLFYVRSLNRIEELFIPRCVMELVHRLDCRLKPCLQRHWGANLFVLRR
jgi:hypothetical protein